MRHKKTCRQNCSQKHNGRLTKHHKYNQNIKLLRLTHQKTYSQIIINKSPTTQKAYKLQKSLIITISNTPISPNTMMVHFFNTYPTC